jgi:hypothetical protein
MRKMLFALLLGILLLTGCSERVHTPRIVPEWGRAGRIGIASRSTPAGLYVSPDGERIVLTWPTRAEGATEDRLHLMVLDANGTVLIDQDLEPPIADLETVQLLADKRGMLWLFWSAGTPDARALWFAPLPNIDQLEIAPLSTLSIAPISPPDASLTWYKALTLASDDILVLWLDGYGELSAQRIGEGNPQVLLSDVAGADIQIDNAGNVHLTWSTQTASTQVALYHAQIKADTLSVTLPVLVAEAFLPPRTSLNTLEGPVISLDRSRAYVSWVQRENSSVQVVKRLHIATFPLDDPSSAVELQPLAHDTAFPPVVVRATGDFAYQHLALPAVTRGSQFNVRGASTTLDGQGAETVLALSVQYNTRTRQEYQPTLVYLRDGAPLGYQALTWTGHTSVSPVVAADAAHHLYVAWIDTTGAAYHYPVYLASTAPALRASWQRMTLADYATIVWDYTNRIASGVVLFPFTVMWFFPSLLWLFVKLSRGGDVYGQTGQRLLLSTLWIYWAAKYILTFQILAYVPGLRYVPSSVSDVLIFLVPLLTLALSIIVGGLTTIRWTGKAFSVMRTFLVTTAVDAILSLSVYAIGYYE